MDIEIETVFIRVHEAWHQTKPIGQLIADSLVRDVGGVDDLARIQGLWSHEAKITKRRLGKWDGGKHGIADISVRSTELKLRIEKLEDDGYLLSIELIW